MNKMALVNFTARNFASAKRKYMVFALKRGKNEPLNKNQLCEVSIKKRGFEDKFQTLFSFGGAKNFITLNDPAREVVLDIEFPKGTPTGIYQVQVVQVQALSPYRAALDPRHDTLSFFDQLQYPVDDFDPDYLRWEWFTISYISGKDAESVRHVSEDAKRVEKLVNDFSKSPEVFVNELLFNADGLYAELKGLQDAVNEMFAKLPASMKQKGSDAQTFLQPFVNASQVIELVRNAQWQRWLFNQVSQQLGYWAFSLKGGKPVRLQSEVFNEPGFKNQRNAVLKIVKDTYVDKMNAMVEGAQWLQSKLQKNIEAPQRKEYTPKKFSRREVVGAR